MSANDFASVRVVGGLLPPDLLARIIAGDSSLGGLTSSDYHLSSGESPREAANRAWAYLLGAWKTYKQALERLPEGDPAVGLTRERWLTVLFKELDYGRLQQTPPGGLAIDDKSFPVSHIWGATPMHLLGWGVDLDKRTKGVPGAAERAPQAMVQESLNRSSDYLWAVLANGRTVRLLRDSSSLAGQAYVEFDLETMFDGELFSDFALLYLLLHQSRVEVPDDGGPSDCWLEKWRTNAAESGTRALGLLRDGVKDAIEALGTGFLQAPGNDLNSRLSDGTLRIEDYHRSLLRLVYRLLFLFVAEDRGLLHDPAATAAQRDRYRAYFSTGRLRALARKRRGSRHTDLWQALELVISALGDEGGRPEMGLPGLGGIFNDEPIDVITGQQLPNQALLTAIRKLSVVHPKGSLPRVVDYRNLGAEELGSIYESLLELVPRHDQVEHNFTLEQLAGNERKTSGSYYTPSSLIDLVLDEALDPILDERERAKDPEQALLSITVCDPACGSGHFLVAAARRIATRLAAVRTGEADPTPTDVQAALHDVVAKCIYGVDLNPMAAELAKVSLWLEAMQPGKPLSFLDAHIKVGNALLGATPRLLADGIPDAAFDPIEGDDKKYAAALRKRNKAEREKGAEGDQGDLFDSQVLEASNAHLRSAIEQALGNALTVTSLAEVHEAARRYRQVQDSPEALAARMQADAWCAAFVQRQVPGAPAITQAALDDPSPDVQDEVRRLAASFRFLHWQLEFPEVFDATGAQHEHFNTDTGWSGGFTVMVGNPPWERVKLQEQEFFASRDEVIATAVNAAARKKLIAALPESSPALWAEWSAARRQSEGESHLLRNSGRYPLCGRGDVNTYSVFAELFRSSIEHLGRMGIITPTGLATDTTTSEFFADSLRGQRLAAFYDFENEAKIFPAVTNKQHFCVTSLSGGQPLASARFAAFVRHVVDLPNRRFALTAQELLLLNPNTGNLPVFRSRRDAEIAIGIYRRHPILMKDDDPDGNPWGLSFMRMFDMANDSDLFRTASELEAQGAQFDGWAWSTADRRWLPLYEAKMLGHYDHRFATYAGATQAQMNKGTLPRLTDFQHDDPSCEPRARYWVSIEQVDRSLQDFQGSDWLVGWRDISHPANERSLIPSFLPRAAAAHVFPLLAGAAEPDLLYAVLASLACDYVVRQKLAGSHVTYGLLSQIAIPRPEALHVSSAWGVSDLANWIRVRVLELAFTSDRIAPLALSLGDAEDPFRWVPERRVAIRAELDAVMFHLYGLERDEVAHVLDSFFVVRKYEERDFGEFRTKRLVLERYDAMAEAAASGVPYETPIDPPPGFGPRHDPSTRPDWLKENA